VDSVTVEGNTKTKDFAVLREMELRPGMILQPEIWERDRRYLQDLGLFAAMSFRADSLGPGRCALRVKVKERSDLFLKMLVPVVNYDFEKGYSYGLRWNDRNFRGRRERLYASYMLESDHDERATLGWFAPWIGWEHLQLLADFSYFRRGEDPAGEAITESESFTAYVGIPLTESRIAYYQALTSLSWQRRKSLDARGRTVEQHFLEPMVGLRFDSRDSWLRPHRGALFFMELRLFEAVSGPSQRYYSLREDYRAFLTFHERLTLGMLSALSYQFGHYPRYSTVQLGGASTLRGYAAGTFEGAHRWYQTLELRWEVLPRLVFKLPYVGFVDVGLSVVAFVDGGIAWRSEGEFRADRFHGGAGLGFRLYSPFQDVVRMDIGFNSSGAVYPYLGTGVRF